MHQQIEGIKEAFKARIVFDFLTAVRQRTDVFLSVFQLLSLLLIDQRQIVTSQRPVFLV